MCGDCFEDEKTSFPTEKDWLSFDLVLTKKLGSDKMKELSFVGDGKRDKDDGQYIYECQSCGQKWRLRDPDNSDRGHFLKLEAEGGLRVYNAQVTVTKVLLILAAIAMLNPWFLIIAFPFYLLMCVAMLLTGLPRQEILKWTLIPLAVDATIYAAFMTTIWYFEL